MEQKIKLKTLFVYSKMNQAIQIGLESYLKSSVITQYISTPKYQKVEEINPSSFSDAVKQYDIFFFLISMELLTHDFLQNPIMSKALEYHKMNDPGASPEVSPTR